MKTESTKVADVNRKWFLVDAEGKTLGRISTEIAKILRGKHRPTFTPHMDAGDFVVVINAEKVVVTGKKEDNKRYYRHSGWVGGIRSTTVRELREQKPTEIIKKAVWGMIPKGPLGRKVYSKLKVYAGTEHPHEAQQPEAISFA